MYNSLSLFSPLIFDLSRNRESVIFASSCDFEKLIESFILSSWSFCFLLFLRKRENLTLSFSLRTLDNSVRKLAVPYKIKAISFVKHTLDISSLNELLVSHPSVSTVAYQKKEKVLKKSACQSLLSFLFSSFSSVDISYLFSVLFYDLFKFPVYKVFGLGLTDLLASKDTQHFLEISVWFPLSIF